MADTKLTGLPVPPTDSIFAVIAEETGVLGTTFVIVLYVLLVWRGMLIARRAPDMLGSLLASGITLWIAIEAFINMAVMVGLLPFAGNALPLISAGGSNLVVTLSAIGILLNISRLSAAESQPPERKANATNGVRRSNRRRDQSRARRAASARQR
jgi:cell division protein FtsW